MPQGAVLGGLDAAHFRRDGGVMEDGPEAAEGEYRHGEKTYTLREQDSERWQVFDGARYLGVVLATPGSRETGPEYTIDFAGEEDKYDEPATDDWRLVLEYLIDNSTPPIGT
jgi:hypothetical protein